MVVCDPVVEIESIAVTKPDVEQCSREVTTLREGQLCGAHAIHGRDDVAVGFEGTANDFANYGLILDVENRHAAA